MKKKYKVIFVDDERELSLLFVEYCEEEESLEAVAFSSSKEALEYALDEDNGVSFIVLDWAMPEVSGAEFIKRLREKGVKTPIAIYSGHVIEKLEKDINKVDVVEVFSKPADFEEIINCVKYYVKIEE
jgi:FixJ family two-component response regulator